MYFETLITFQNIIYYETERVYKKKYPTLLNSLTVSDRWMISWVVAFDSSLHLTYTHKLSDLS